MCCCVELNPVRPGWTVRLPAGVRLPEGVKKVQVQVRARGQDRSEGLRLVTNNVGEFERVPGLLLENWVGSLT